MAAMIVGAAGITVTGFASAETIGTCSDDGYELTIERADLQFGGLSAFDAAEILETLEPKMELTSLTVGKLQRSETCTRIEWASAGGCVKASARIEVPKLTEKPAAACSNFDRTAEALADTFKKQLERDVVRYRNTLGRCVSEEDHAKREATARKIALEGRPYDRRKMTEYINDVIEGASGRLKRCTPTLTFSSYGTGAYYQFNDDGQKSCGPLLDDAAFGLRGSSNRALEFYPLEITLQGAIDTPFMRVNSRTHFAQFASLPGTIAATSQCEPRPPFQYVETLPVVVMVDTPVYFSTNGLTDSRPSLSKTFTVEARCQNTRCN